MTIREVGDGHDELKARLLRAAIGYLHTQWPTAVTITPSTLGDDFYAQDRLFIEIVQALIDDGLISVEFFLIGSTTEPMARETLLTRKGASARLDGI